MTVSELLESVQFVVDRDGNVTAAILDRGAWEAFIELLEDSEDRELVRERMQHWRSKQGWTSWEEFSAELAVEQKSDELPTVD